MLQAPKSRSATLAIFLVLSGCSGYGGSWPSLSAPLPSEEDRVRVSERAEPAAPEPSQPVQLLTQEDAEKIIAETQSAISDARQLYEARVSAFQAAVDADDRISAWNAAQLALTRLSQAASPLDAVLYHTETDPPQREAAMQLVDKLETYVVAARQALAKTRPQN